MKKHLIKKSSTVLLVLADCTEVSKNVNAMDSILRNQEILKFFLFFKKFQSELVMITSDDEDSDKKVTCFVIAVKSKIVRYASVYRDLRMPQRRNLKVIL